MIRNIKIKGLYGMYDYNIHFSKFQKVTILTGPNGYGKTTILKIINHLIKRDFWYFNLLLFKDIHIEFDDGCTFLIHKGDSLELDIDFGEKPDNRAISGIVVIYKNQDGECNQINLSRSYFLRTVRRQISPRYSYSDLQYEDLEDLLDRKYDPQRDDALPEAISNINKYLQSKSVLYVKEQRIKYDAIDEQRFSRNLVSKYNIEQIVEELKQLYGIYQTKFAEKCEEIDSKFVERLLTNEEEENLNKEKYDEIVRRLKDIVGNYQHFGLARDFNINYEYTEKYREVLYLFISDVLDKLEVYLPFYQSLSFFEKFIQEKTLSNKEMHLDANKGLVIVDKNGLEVPLRKLSSGEQNLIILYFNLLFKTKQGEILLIDEPENSIHAAWQETMLDDFKQIAKVNGLQVIFASHSLEFINGDWDDCVDLNKINENEQG